MADIVDVKALDFIIDEEEKLDFVVDEEDASLDFEVESFVNIATNNYNELINHPSINEVELIGNKTFEDLGDKVLSNVEIKAIYDRVFRN